MIDAAISDGSVRLRFEVTGGPVPVTVVALANGRSRIVRGWDAEPVDGTAVVVDHEVSLGVPVRYAWLDDGVEQEHITVLVPSDYPLVSDPVTGRSVPVIIREWPEFAHDREGHVVEIARASIPVIIEGVERSAVSLLSLIHVDDAGAQELESLLADASVVQIRPTCPRLPDAWVSVRGRTRRPFSKAVDAAWMDALEVRHTGIPNPEIRAVSVTLGDLHDTVPTTLGDIATQWPGVLADIVFEVVA